MSESTQIDPKDAAGYTGRGGAHYLKGEFKEAVEDYNKVVQMQPQDARPLAQRGSGPISPCRGPGPARRKR